jgi:hypothetical protein
VSDAPVSEGGDAGAIALDAADLDVGGGLLALLRPALARLAPGGVLALGSSSPQVREDLPAWCRLERHEYLGRAALPDGRDRHLLARGAHGVTPDPGSAGARLDPTRPPRTADLVALCPPPERADPASGFAPRGTRVEPGGPPFPFTLLDRDRAAPPQAADLYERAVAAQWDATRDIPWDRTLRLPPPLGRALAQIMSFLAENELAALYVPSRFLARLHPAYLEMAMLLAIQLADEARHIDVFLKRAWLAAEDRGGLGLSSATTALSLRTLLSYEDFTEASFLLSVLGEGTFLDLLHFVQQHAPDEATEEIARRARADEGRHVHLGLCHVRHALASDPAVALRLEVAVRHRAAVMQAEAIPGHIQDALTILAARGTDPPSVARGHAAFRALLATMSTNRERRLQSAGFSPEQATRLGQLHTPNFM